MSKRAVILHGTYGSPNGNWFQWLRVQLESQGLNVWTPELPDAKEPSLREWVNYIHEHKPFTLDDETIIIGHSSGAVLALLLAQENTQPIGSLVAVSVFSDQYDGASEALTMSPNHRLFDVIFDWKRIHSNVISQIVCVHSDDDPYVPLAQAKQVASLAAAEFLVWESQGHFNLEKSKSYDKFPRLLNLLESHNML